MNTGHEALTEITLPSDPTEPPQAPKALKRTVTPKPRKTTPQPDRWVVTPIAYNKDGTEKPSHLIYYKNNEPITKIKITEDNFAELTAILQAKLNPTNNLRPAEWQIRIPTITEENPNPEPVLTFNTKNRIFMTLPLSQEFLKKFAKTLNSYINKEPTKSEQMNTWWHRHKIARTFLIIISLPIILAFIYAIGWFQTIGA